MSFLNTKDNIDQMRIQLQGITSLFESSYLKISSELSLLDMRMTQLEVAADPNAGSERDEDFLTFSKKAVDRLMIPLYFLDENFSPNIVWSWI